MGPAAVILLDFCCDAPFIVLSAAQQFSFINPIGYERNCRL
jgi:hypothetical protein